MADASVANPVGLDHLEGLFVGQLTSEELELFEEAVKDGRATRSYEGATGFMGLAKVRLATEAPHG